MNLPKAAVKPLWLMLVLSATAPVLAACEEEGPLEETGEEIGDAADDIEDEL